MIAGLIAAALLLALALALGQVWAGRAGVRGALARAEQLCGRRFSGWLPQRMVQAIEMLIERLTAQEHRMQSMHSVTGLPTREPLAARMTSDGTGTLAVLACKDYDRLCVFDAALAERLLREIADRITAMMPSTHLLAQVDRSHLAIWIGPDVPSIVATSQADALCYALGEKIVVGDREILPEIVARKVGFDSASCSAHSAISQTLSTFSLSSSATAVNQSTHNSLAPQERERFQIEQDLRQAIARNQLRLLYQPLLDATQNRVCGAEALLRWEHAERGLIQPSRFLPIAEAAGLNHEIGLWALNRACRDAKSWTSGELRDLRVAVNITGHQLEAHDLALLIARTLERHGLEPRHLEVELTESVALANDVRATILCEELRRLGVEIAIDDFGTGYSSLSALRNLAFDKIKIDRTFITEVHKRRDSQAICSSLFDLGRGLGINVLAEGVETAEEYRWLRSRGCRLFQGFYFAEPLASEDFIAFAENWKATHSLDEMTKVERLSA